MDVDLLAHALESRSSTEHARKRRQHVQPMRGVRGTPDGEVARVLAAAWQAHPPRLPADGDALDRLFAGPFEDGLVAIGLLAAVAPDAPGEALEIGLGWLDRVDDVITADALGWLVLGPSGLASGRFDEVVAATRAHAGSEVRRAGVAAAMALTPARLEGPAAAALRERVGERAVRFVDAAVLSPLASVATAFLRDEAPTVRKALRRLLRAWADAEPASLVAWADGVRGGLPKLLREEVDRARRRA